jgi:protein-tyrosine phosphatase
MRLLFVCSGNTCRSPLAVAAWMAAAPAQGSSAVAESAGLGACHGAPATPEAVAVARGWGVDLTRHQSRPLTPAMAQSADLILTMTPDQAEQIVRRYNIEPRRVRLLGEFAAPETRANAVDLDAMIGEMSCFEDAGNAILDPFGGSLEAYQACATQIASAVNGLARALQEGNIVRGRP